MYKSLISQTKSSENHTKTRYLYIKLKAVTGAPLLRSNYIYSILAIFGDDSEDKEQQLEMKKDI